MKAFVTDTNLSSALEARHVRRRYGAKHALDGVNLSIPAAGGVTALLGPNGAGKSTLVNCALGLSRISGGELRTFDRLPGSIFARKRIGVMLQDAELPENLTGREHIRLFASYYADPIPTDDVIAQCMIGEFADIAYQKLSGGQKRRVQFALAIVGRPDLVFLDEPTAGLDIDARRNLWSVIRTIAENGAAVVLATHYLDEADLLADRIIVIGKGRIISDAPTPQFREKLGCGVIRCGTRLSGEALCGLPAVRSAHRTGRFAEVSTYDAALTLRALFEADETIHNLTVREPTLEDVFLDITNPRSPGSEG